MDKLSEYIPIIIILFSVVFSIIGKKKKQGSATQETTLPGKKAERGVDKREVDRTVSSQNRRIVSEKTKKPVFIGSGISNIKESISPFSSEIVNLEIKDEIEDSFISFEDEDDVKRAVIYAEILGKKEY